MGRRVTKVQAVIAQGYHGRRVRLTEIHPTDRDDIVKFLAGEWMPRSYIQATFRRVLREIEEVQ